MHKGYLCIVLHAHLPYIRHPEHDYFLEENWFYEAITETYIPLLDIFERLLNENTDFRITLSLSPPLVEMFNDDLLRWRYQRYLNGLIELSERERFRTRGDIHFGPIIKMYSQRFRRIQYLFEVVYRKDLTSAFKALRDTGNVELIPSVATHAFLPNLSMYPQAVRAQMKIAAEHFKNNFQRPPSGIWLPECGYAPGIDRYVREEDIQLFFLDTHGILHGRPLPRYGVYAPVLCPSGVFAFGRDVETSKQVWSSVGGYPGDFDYRDFYRDIGFDLNDIRPYIHPDGIRTYTGLKYYRITGKTDKKEPYVIEQAKKKTAEHAAHFISKINLQIDFLSETFKNRQISLKPMINSLYDAELFGHWWFEGPDWLNFVLKGINQRHVNFRTITPSEYLSSLTPYYTDVEFCQPSMSSWGHKGYSEVWLNDSNDYIYCHLHKMVERMTYLAGRFHNADGILRRSLNQALRELLLSQHSDWAFIMDSSTAAEYAKKRLEEHIIRFDTLYQAIISGNLSESWLEEIEKKDRIFQEIDYRVYRNGE